MAIPQKPLTRLAELAATITASVAELDKIIAAKGVPSPSFDEDGHTVPAEAADAQDAVLEAAGELIDLLRDPLTVLFLDGSPNTNLPLQFIAKFRVADMVPAGGMVSYATIAEKTGIDEQFVRRLLRYAMTMRVFREPEPNMVAHSRTSKALTDPDIPLNDWLKVGTLEMWPSSIKTLEAAEKWPGSSEPNQTGYNLANNTPDPIYAMFAREPERAVAFANAMKVFSLQPEYDPRFITDYYDWASLGDKVRVVDVGGSRGHVAMALAEKHPNLTFVVQDMAMAVAGAEAGVPEKLKGRIEFQAHDLFEEQAVDGDIFYLRWILHNWSDKYCIQILRAQIPALKKGTKVIIQEQVMPEPGQISNWKEKSHRLGDMNMASIFNAKERTVAEWRELLAAADPRFALKNVTEPKGSALAILEIVWNE